MYRPFSDLALDWVDDARVSTVFLVYGDYSVTPALVYETRVYGGPSDGDQRRYATKEEAAAGHAAIVAGLRQMS